MRIVGDAVRGEPANRNAAIAAVERAVELGADFSDTADSYGPNISKRPASYAMTTPTCSSKRRADRFHSTANTTSAGPEGLQDRSSNVGNILMVVSATDSLTMRDGSEHPTGHGAEEVAVAHKNLLDAGHAVRIATPGGMKPTVDQVSLAAESAGGRNGRTASASTSL